MNRVARTEWALPLVALAWGSIVLVANSSGQSIGAYLLYYFGGLAFAILALIVGVLYVRSARRRKLTLVHTFPAQFLLYLAVLAVVFTGVSLGVAFDVRFALSQAALERTAGEVQAGHSVATPTTIGLFRVAEIDTAGSSVRFIIGEAGLDDSGLVYIESGRPPVVGEDSYEHISGSWWGWRRSW